MVIGLTGSFGSGKSTVASMFADRGVPVLDADQAARDVVARGTEGLEEIVEAFGDSILTAEGELDRKKMADIVFNDPEARGKLNGIVHPRVGGAMREFLAEHDSAPVQVLEIPLLLEGGSRSIVDKVVVVTTSEEARIERLKRSGYDEEEISARLASQMPQEEKVALADYVIRNDGDLKSTLGQVEELARELGIETKVKS